MAKGLVKKGPARRLPKWARRELAEEARLPGPDRRIAQALAASGESAGTARLEREGDPRV